MNLILFLLKSSWRMMTIATVIATVSGGCQALLIALVNDAINESHHITLPLLLIFAAMLLTMLVTGTISQYLLVKLSQGAVMDLRQRLVDWTFASPLAQLERLGSNQLFAAFTDDVDTVADSVLAIPSLFVNVTVIAGCLIYLCWLDWRVFLGISILLIVMYVVIHWLITQSEGLLKLARNEQDDMIKHFRAITDGIKELKLNRCRRYGFVNEEFRVTATNRKRYNVASMTLLGFTINLGNIMYFGILGALIFLLPQLTGATAAILSGYALVVTNLMEPVGEILQALPQLTQANVALQKVQSLGLVLAGNIESTASKHFEALSLSECAPISNFQTLEFRQITYSYHQVDNGQPFVLGPINITIQRGELIFIVGGNGSGKSSFAKLITGLYTPEFGEIRVNHRLVLDGDREAYRQLFSTVFSDFYLFNRLFGVSSQNLDYQVSEYLKLLQLDHKVQVEAGVLSTINLSQGQRKRLALVAAYLEDRPIYLFDEWASDQDPYFREIFYKKLLPDLKQRGKTVLAISHDDRYFHVADRLIKLDYGKVV